MVRKYVYGTPFETDAVVSEFKAEQGKENFEAGQVSLKDGFSFSYQMAAESHGGQTFFIRRP